MTANEASDERPSLFSLALNYLPFVYLAAGAALAAMLPLTALELCGVVLAWIYVLPALAGGLTVRLLGRPEGQFRQGCRSYRIWWFLTQLQVIFNRLPFLEEILRLVPGLYALWIGLWGGRLSPFAYVAPGVTITDRFAVHVGRYAILGMRSALAGHMVTRDASGRWSVFVAAPHVMAGAVLAGDGGLGPGARLGAGAMLPYGRKLGPMARWPRVTGGEVHGG